VTELTPWQYVAMTRKHEHFCMFGGIAVGKTFTGAHFTIANVEAHPELTGLIGANTYDQLSQASMRELLFWLDEYGYEFEVDSRPKGDSKRQFKTYKNVLSIKSKNRPDIWTPVFTRIMSEPDALRGTEFSWYWLDESRDTPMNTHDIVLSRMRESKTYRRGLITTTTNGEDWAYQRFVKGCRQGQHMYGSMHVPTKAALDVGLLAPEFYNTLLESYSPLMAQQELDAMHVNVRGGRAYYAASETNRKHVAPWGDHYPDPDRPLIVGADFNYSPAPCVWMVGQQGPETDDRMGGLWSQHIHWFGEISGSEVSSPQMANMLIGRFPGFFYRIFGDSYGNIGTTSNAGQHDYAQVGAVLDQAQCAYMIDVAQSNPHVKDRVENMNRMLKNSLGQTRMTYNPTACPLFDSDMKIVGWKKTISQGGRAKLDNGGKKELTHASDGGGYAVWKLYPYGYRGVIGVSVPSISISSVRGAF